MDKKMVIELTPEIEDALAEEAQRRGTTPEQLALDALRRHFLAIPREGEAAGETLFDLLSGYVGVVSGSGEAFSEKCAERFAEGMVEKQRQGHL